MNILYFSATWCGPCKMFKPILQKVTSELGTSVNYIDVDQNSDLVSKYKISSVPTLIIEDQNGTQKLRHSGTMTGEQLKEQLFNTLSQFK